MDKYHQTIIDEAKAVSAATGKELNFFRHRKHHAGERGMHDVIYLCQYKEEREVCFLTMQSFHSFMQEFYTEYAGTIKPDGTIIEPRMKLVRTVKGGG